MWRWFCQETDRTTAFLRASNADHNASGGLLIHARP